MSKVLLFAAALALLDVFPGGGCSCAPTTGGPCKVSCDCDQSLAAPIRCPGQWRCGASQRCEYACAEGCTADGGCATAGLVCNGASCVTPACP